MELRVYRTFSDRFAIYNFAKLWVPAGTKLIMQPLAGSLLASMGRIVGHVRRHFRILSVDSQFLEGGGGGGSSPYSSLGMKMALKNWAGMDSFPIHTDLLSLNILRQFWAQCTISPFLPDGIK